jgi:PAS domain-containing protein
MRVQMTNIADGAGEEAASNKAAAAPPEPLLQSTLDALTMPVALLDETGHIVGINAAWRHIPALPGLNAGIGDNYLQICEAATRQAADASTLRDGCSEFWPDGARRSSVSGAMSRLAVRATFASASNGSAITSLPASWCLTKKSPS